MLSFKGKFRIVGKSNGYPADYPALPSMSSTYKYITLFGEKNETNKCRAIFSTQPPTILYKRYLYQNFQTNTGNRLYHYFLLKWTNCNVRYCNMYSNTYNGWNSYNTASYDSSGDWYTWPPAGVGNTTTSNETVYKSTFKYINYDLYDENGEIFINNYDTDASEYLSEIKTYTIGTYKSLRSDTVNLPPIPTEISSYETLYITRQYESGYNGAKYQLHAINNSCTITCTALYLPPIKIQITASGQNEIKVYSWYPKDLDKKPNSWVYERTDTFTDTKTYTGDREEGEYFYPTENGIKYYFFAATVNVRTSGILGTTIVNGGTLPTKTDEDIKPYPTGLGVESSSYYLGMPLEINNYSFDPRTAFSYQLIKDGAEYYAEYKTRYPSYSGKLYFQLFDNSNNSTKYHFDMNVTTNGYPRLNRIIEVNNGEENYSITVPDTTITNKMVGFSSVLFGNMTQDRAYGFTSSSTLVQSTENIANSDAIREAYMCFCCVGLNATKYSEINGIMSAFYVYPTETSSYSNFEANQQLMDIYTNLYSDGIKPESSGLKCLGSGTYTVYEENSNLDWARVFSYIYDENPVTNPEQPDLIDNSDPLNTGGSTVINPTESDGGHGTGTDTNAADNQSASQLLPSGISEVVNIGFMNGYVMTKQQIEAFSRFFWQINPTNTNIIENNGTVSFQALFEQIDRNFTLKRNNIFDAVLFINFYPISLTDLQLSTNFYSDKNGFYIGTNHINYGYNLATNEIESPFLYQKITKQIVQIDMGTVTINEISKSYIDYEPYTSIYCHLPYITTVALNTDEVINQPIKVTYTIDLFTGACIAHIIRVNDSKILGAYSGTIGYKIPFTSNDVTSIYASDLHTFADWTQGIAKMASGTIEGALMGSGIGGVGAGIGAAAGFALSAIPTLSGLTASTVDNTLAGKHMFNRGGGVGGTNGLLDSQSVYFLRTYPQVVVPEYRNQFTGYPLYQYKKLSDVKGFTIVENMNMTTLECTEEEKTELIQLLKQGVIL